MKYKILVGLGIICFSLIFYWFAYRPSQIKQECSWMKHHQDAVPAIPAKTEKELRVEGIVKDCIVPTSIPGEFLTLTESKRKFCGDNQKIIDEYKNPRPEIPVKDWLEKATNSEYLFCLHSKGL